jgi:hypothetical protein
MKPLVDPDVQQFHRRELMRLADAATSPDRLQRAVDAARDDGVGWSEIGQALGMRRGNAYQRFRRRPARSDVA